jgi:ABC-2 type transport system permease protein
MKLWIQYRRELKGFFVSPIAYLVLFACSLINGASFTFWMYYLAYSNTRDFNIVQACMNAFFFWFLLIVQVPLITMRSFAEEYKLGTIELLLTAPIREWEVVLAKFLATFTFFILLWTPLAVCLGILRWVNGQPLGIGIGMTVLPFTLLAFIGMFLIAIGLFSSSLTKNQVIAAILAFAAIFLVFSLSFLVYLGIGRGAREIVTYLSFLDQMDAFSRGVFDSRPVVLYVSATALLLFLTERVLVWRRLAD